MVDYLTVVAFGVGVFYAAYFFNLLSGVAKNLYSVSLDFSWKALLRGIAKWLIVGFVTIGVASVVYLTGWYGNHVGIEWGVAAQALSKDALIAAIASGVGYQVASAVSNIVFIYKAGNKDPFDIEIDEELDGFDYETIAHEIRGAVAEVKDFLTPKKYAEKHGEWEEVGGIGANYTVPTESFEAFKNATIGKGYDIDGFYGQQCWDYAALLWQQFGLRLVTGNGLAIGCWDLKREINKCDKFDLVYSADDLRAGDVVVMRPNHIGFFAGWNGNYMQILGQNQGGTPCAAGGSSVNIVNIAKSSFAGAFRLKAWNQVTTAQVNFQPAPKAATAVADATQKQPSGSNTQNHSQNSVQYKYKKGDTLGQVIKDLNLTSQHGLWGANGDVEYYTKQLHTQGIFGNVPIGATITLTKRTD